MVTDPPVDHRAGSFGARVPVSNRYAGGRTPSTISPMPLVHWCTPP